MVELLATTIISCTDAARIITRITNVVGITLHQKVELIQTIKQFVPTCPLKIVPDERPKSSS
jgi:hypothetical protein